MHVLTQLKKIAIAGLFPLACLLAHGARVAEGTFARVVLIPDETNATYLLGFCNGRSIPGDEQTICVFVPAAPNPIHGRLYFVRRERCQLIDVSTEEAFKVILSTGNHIPPELGAAMCALGPPPTTITRVS